MALMNRSLNDPQGGFDGQGEGGTSDWTSLDVARLEFHVEKPASLASVSTTNIVDFPSNGQPSDLLDQLCANLEIRTDTAKLGVRFNDDKKSAAPYPLNVDTFNGVFARAAEIRARPRRQRPVFVEVVNLTPTVQPEPVKTKGKGNTKPTDGTISNTERGLREKLSCRCQGKHTFCFVGPGGRHIQLTDEQVGLWARLITNNSANENELPNILSFDNTSIDASRDRPIRANKSSSGSSNLPPIHIHLGNKRRRDDDDPLSSIENTPEKPSRRRRLNDDNDDLIPTPLGGILADLDKRYPDLGGLSKHWPALKEEGIAYLDAAAKFNKEYFIDKIGMKPGMAVIFYDHIQKEYTSWKKGKGKAVLLLPDFSGVGGHDVSA